MHDIENDGDLDILSAGSYDSNNKLAIFFNDGQENFSELVINSDNASGTEWVSVGDLIPGGSLEIIASSTDNQRVTMYHDDGTLTFSNSVILLDNYHTNFSMPVDIDMDGDLDIYFQGYNSNIEALYGFLENDGSGNFQEMLVNITNHSATGRGTFFEDLNLDGWLDFIQVASSVGTEGVFYIENLIIEGCTDQFAANYNPDATQNDGSCTYPDNGSYVLDFSSSSAYTHLDWSDNLDNYTLSIWVKPNSENQPIYASYFSSHYPNSNGFQLDSDGNGNYRFLSVNGTITIAPLSLEWSHVVLVAETKEDGEEKTTVYFNGDSISSINYVDNNWNKINLGRNRNQDGNGYGNYRVDNVLIWDTPLSSEQIQTHIEYGTIEQSDNLLIHWKLNAGTGDLVYDHSGNSHHATTYNTTWIEDGLIFGCTDPLSVNYNPDANFGNEFCDYMENGNNVLQFNGDHDYVNVPHDDSQNMTDSTIDVALMA